MNTEQLFQTFIKAEYQRYFIGGMRKTWEEGRRKEISHKASHAGDGAAMAKPRWSGRFSFFLHGCPLEGCGESELCTGWIGPLCWCKWEPSVEMAPLTTTPKNVTNGIPTANWGSEFTGQREKMKSNVISLSPTCFLSMQSSICTARWRQCTVVYKQQHKRLCWYWRIFRALNVTRLIKTC